MKELIPGEWWGIESIIVGNNFELPGLRKLKTIATFIYLFSFLLCFQIGVRGQQKENSEAYISVGLLVDENNETEASIAVQNAIQLINEKGGVKGEKLNLITRSVEGTWGAGSSKIVELVFEEKVIAIIGSLDARNTHLAEQVIAKTQVPFLSAWASDSSLTNAYVSWFFSIVPNDEQQAQILLNETCINKNLKELMVVFDGSYDSDQAYKSLLEKAEQFPELEIHPLRFQAQEDASKVVAEMRKNRADGLIFLGRELPLKTIQELMISAKINIPVFGNVAAHGSKDILDNKDFIMPFTNSWINGNKALCEELYFRTKEKKCNIIRALAFDAVMTLKSALEISKGDQNELKAGLGQVNYQGITGPIEFDSLGRIKTSE